MNLKSFNQTMFSNAELETKEQTENDLFMIKHIHFEII